VAKSRDHHLYVDKTQLYVSTDAVYNCSKGFIYRVLTSCFLLSILFHNAHTVEIPDLFNVCLHVLDIFYCPPSMVSSRSGVLADSETATVVNAEQYLVD
jgi:hypothetical protein